MEEDLRRGNELVDGVVGRSAEEAYHADEIKDFKAQYDRDVKRLKEGLRLLERSFAYRNTVLCVR